MYCVLSAHLRGNALALSRHDLRLEGIRGERGFFRVNRAVRDAPVRDVERRVGVVAALDDSPRVLDRGRRGAVERLEVHGDTRTCARDHITLLVPHLSRTHHRLMNNNEHSNQPQYTPP